MKNYAMRFISGKYQGGEFPLPTNSEIIVGRSSDLDMVLVEDMVSRRHAKISVNSDAVAIQDLGSTNGTFVNGERVERMTLTEGDRVLIGTSIIKLVTTEGPPSTASQPKKRLEEVAAGRRTNQVRSMSGAIDEVPLPDLLQLFGSSRKTGVLVIKSETDLGKVFLERGSIVFASINDSDALGPEKAVHRILAWRHGTFYMEPSEELEVQTRIELSTEAALMEGMRIYDEVARFDLPPMRSTLRFALPLRGKLSELNGTQLDVLQVGMSASSLENLFNNCGLPDVEIAAALNVLLQRGYLEATPVPEE
jgi:pSer/pThr/pTyr-binding forkhead associated (FHA) protein